MIEIVQLLFIFNIHIINVNSHFYKQILAAEVDFLISAVIIHFCASNQETM
jgi:hypothetical protein